ncbi:MAG TPA: hypothetical protein DCR15_18065 [Arthrobacter bacterium]|nr:hypothetical protein [Arthrobacter sp.]
MEFKDVGVLVGAVATATGILITIFSLLNLKSRAHALATQCFALAKTLDAQMDKEEEAEVRRVATQLRRELLVRGHEASQDFLSRTTPKRMNLITILAWFVIFIPLTATIWNVRNVPSEWEWLRNLLGLGVPAAVVLICSTLWVMTTKKMDIEEALALKRMTPDPQPPSKTGLAALLAVGTSVGGMLFRWARLTGRRETS